MSRAKTMARLHAYYNEKEFGGKLRTPEFTVIRSGNIDGWYEHCPASARDVGTIALSRDCFADEELLRGTLLHEMLHQYQHEVLQRTCTHDAVFCSMARRLERKYNFTI